MRCDAMPHIPRAIWGGGGAEVFALSDSYKFTCGQQTAKQMENKSRVEHTHHRRPPSHQHARTAAHLHNGQLACVRGVPQLAAVEASNVHEIFQVLWSLLLHGRHRAIASNVPNLQTTTKAAKAGGDNARTHGRTMRHKLASPRGRGRGALTC